MRWRVLNFKVIFFFIANDSERGAWFTQKWSNTVGIILYSLQFFTVLFQIFERVLRNFKTFIFKACIISCIQFKIDLRGYVIKKKKKQIIYCHKKKRFLKTVKSRVYLVLYFKHIR